MTREDTLDEIARDNDDRDTSDKPLTEAETALSYCIPARCIPYDRV